MLYEIWLHLTYFTLQERSMKFFMYTKYILQIRIKFSENSEILSLMTMSKNVADFPRYICSYMLSLHWWTSQKFFLPTHRNLLGHGGVALERESSMKPETKYLLLSFPHWHSTPWKPLLSLCSGYCGDWLIWLFTPPSSLRQFLLTQIQKRIP